MLELQQFDASIIGFSVLDSHEICIQQFLRMGGFKNKNKTIYWVGPVGA